MFPINLPKVLTLLRILAVPVSSWPCSARPLTATLLAAVVFALAAMTDGLDGYFARSREAITTFGKLMDPIADKLLVVAALVSLVSLDRLASLGGDGHHRARVRGDRDARDGGRARRRDRRQLARQGQDRAADRRRISLIAVNPAPAWLDVLVYLPSRSTLISGVEYFFGLRRRIEAAREARAVAKGTKPS